MRIEEALGAAERVFLDTSPLIYFVERHSNYHALVRPLFERLAARTLAATVSAVTLAECLVVPLRNGDAELQARFERLLLDPRNVTFMPVDSQLAKAAAGLRARTGLRLPDAIQVAAAQAGECDALFTNDPAFRRVPYPRVILIDELSLA